MKSSDGEGLMSDDERGTPLYIDVRRFLANKAGAEAVGIAMDLIGLVWWLPFLVGDVGLVRDNAKQLKFTPGSAGFSD
jgi:hypothetical protein